MNLPPFLLDAWLNRFHGIEFDLGSTTGPAWTLDEVLQLSGGALNLGSLTYQPAAGTTPLREAVARMHGVAADDVLITTGASEALHMLFFTLCEPGDNIVLPFPVFPSSTAIPQSLGIEVRSYHLRKEHGFRIDMDEVRGLMDNRTRLLLINSPHNPTGNVLTPAEFTTIHHIAHDRGIPLVSDEVYMPLFFGPGHASAATLPGAIATGSFSKALSLSGLRLGWLIDRDATRRSRLLSARMYFTICNSPVCEAIALRALAHSQPVIEKTKAQAQTNLATLAAFCSANAEHLGWIPPEGGTTCFPWLKDAEDSRPLCEALAGQGILLVPGDCFGQKQHFRIGFAKSARFSEALPRVALALNAAAAVPVL